MPKCAILVHETYKSVLVVWIALFTSRGGLGLGVLVHILYNNHILWCPVVFASLVRLAKILLSRLVHYRQ